MATKLTWLSDSASTESTGIGESKVCVRIVNLLHPILVEKGSTTFHFLHLQMETTLGAISIDREPVSKGEWEKSNVAPLPIELFVAA